MTLGVALRTRAEPRPGMTMEVEMTSRSTGVVVLCGSGQAASSLASVPDELHVLLAELEVSGATDVDPWLVEAPSCLLSELREIVAEASEAEPARVVCAVVVHEAPSPEAAAIARASVEALRGDMHSVTPELGRRARLNLVVAGVDRLEALTDALGFLASDDASYLDSSTLDLGGWG
jgi:signal transduction histidine kinase